MPILSMRAKVQCDGCAKTFYADMDQGHKLSEFMVANKWTVHDLGAEAVRGGFAENERGDGIGLSSEQGEHLLCPKCTSIVDEHTPDGKLTHDQVATALNENAGV